MTISLCIGTLGHFLQGQALRRGRGVRPSTVTAGLQMGDAVGTEAKICRCAGNGDIETLQLPFDF